jgi:hypothetical protein
MNVPEERRTLIPEVLPCNGREMKSIGAQDIQGVLTK